MQEKMDTLQAAIADYSKAQAAVTDAGLAINAAADALIAAITASKVQ